MPTRPTGEKAGDGALTAAHRAVAAARAARVPAVDAETLARWLYSDSPPRVVDVRSRVEYRYNKIVTVDGLVACVGSANLNSRSLTHDDEVCLLVHDADVVATLDGHMDEDLALSDELHLPAWRRRRRLVRAKERLAGRIEGWL